MRRAIRAVDAHLEGALSCALYIYIIAAIFIEVVARYAFSASILWAEETAIYAFIWLTYISMASLARSRSHLAFTAIRDAMPPPVQLVLLLVSDVALIVVAAVVLIHIYQPIADSILFEQEMMGADLPLWLATAAIPVGWALATIRVIQRALVSIRRYRTGESLVSGVMAVE